MIVEHNIGYEMGKEVKRGFPSCHAALTSSIKQVVDSWNEVEGRR
jgi:hypothetical protein